VEGQKPQPEFIVSVAPIKDQIRVVKKKLDQLVQKDPSVRKQVEAEIKILEKVWYDLGNLTPF
jgi:hypothetical protein